MMKRILPFVKNSVKYLPIFVLTLFFLSGCASPTYIKINYHLPNKTSIKPAVTKIRLSIVDQRNNPDPLSLTAREKLNNFRDAYMLIMTPDASIGRIYDLKTLFETVFRKRLDQMGIRVVESTSSNIPELEVALTDFHIDLKDFKWHFKMAYATRLMENGKVIVKQSYSGESERANVPGMNDSGTAVSLIYAELINQMDIGALLDKLLPGEKK